MSVTGVVQAGGKSARMGGRPKALLELGGRRLIERVVDAVKPAVDDLLIVTNTPELYAFLGLPMVADVYSDHGSLGGIYSGLRAAPGDVVIPKVGAQLETLHAAYAKSCLGPIETRLVAGRLRIVDFFDDVRVVEIAAREVARYRDPGIVFMNVNTPAELRQARAIAARLA